MNDINNIVFGIRESDLGTARRTVETALAIEMVLHDSLYRGGDYYRSTRTHRGATETFVLQRNFDILDEEVAEPEYAQFALLLYCAAAPDRVEALAMALKGTAELLSVAP